MRWLLFVAVTVLFLRFNGRSWRDAVRILAFGALSGLCARWGFLFCAQGRYVLGVLLFALPFLLARRFVPTTKRR